MEGAGPSPGTALNLPVPAAVTLLIKALTQSLWRLGPAPPGCSLTRHPG